VLVAFALGKYSEEELERIGAEIEACPLCQAALEELDNAVDSVVVDLRGISSPGVSPISPDLEAAIRQAEQISRELWHASPEADEEVSPHGGTLVRSLAVPSRLGQYELIERIGRGGMGSVYRALHTRLKRPVALKLLHPARTREPSAVTRFLREMEAVGQLNHPNLVHAYDAGEVDDQHFLVMELLDGVDLSRLVRAKGPLSLADACEAVRQAALGLQHAHEHGLVHRDVKPSNLMLTVEGQIKVLDLGLARLTTDPAVTGELTETGQVVGTGDYMAPEQAEDVRQADARSDIYALGCTLYYLLAARAPYADPQCATFVQKVLAHAQRPLPPIRSSRPEVPDGLNALLERMLAKAPGQRPQSAAAVAEAIRPWSEGANLEQLARVAASRQTRTESSQPTEVPRAQETANDPPAASATAAEAPKSAASRGIVGLAALAILGVVVLAMVVVQGKRPGRLPLAEATAAQVAVLQVPDPWSPGDHPPPVIARFDAQQASLGQRRWADYLKLPVEQVNSAGMKLVLIPPGQFHMGSSPEEIAQLAREAEAGKYDSWYPARLPAEGPRHTVRITRPLLVAACETTVAQFRQFVDETGYTTDAENDGRGIEGPVASTKRWAQVAEYSWRNPGYTLQDDQPVVGISWNDAVAFCRWLSIKEKRNYRLPTEAEWEYVCRAGATTRYWPGDNAEDLTSVDNLADASLKDILPSSAPASSASDGFPFSAPVASFRPNPFGLYDLHGNVAEWCADWYDDAYYAASPPVDPKGPESGAYRVLRGGHWGRRSHYARSSLRSWGEPAGRTAATGFRVVVAICEPVQL